MIIKFDEFLTSYKDYLIVLTSMPADPIHPGHISCLQAINKFTQTLKASNKDVISVCLVNDDNFLINKKKFSLIPLEDRCYIIDNIKDGIDIVIPYTPSNINDMTVCEAILKIKPKYFMKGGDRRADNTLPEWNVCKEINCQIIDNVGADKKWSSSNYIEQYKNLNKTNKPWGWFKTYISSKRCTVKELFIKKDHKLSLQYHKNRAEMWLITSGIGIAYINNNIISLHEGKLININKLDIHRIKAFTDMTISEWWIGESSEEDIIRIEDDYNRVKINE